MPQCIAMARESDPLILSIGSGGPMIFYYIAVIGILATAPGCWLAFSSWAPRSSLIERLSLAIVLSPAVLSAEYVAIRFIGDNFNGASKILLLCNIPGLLLIWNERRRRSFTEGSPLNRTAVLSTAIIGPLVLTWIVLPETRIYSWHNWMHIANIYQLVDSGQRLEEMDFAGMALSYPWLGAVQIAAASALIDRAPTLVYPAFNCLTLFGTFVLMQAAALKFRPTSAFRAGLGTLIVLLGTGFLGMLCMRIPPLYRLTDLRVTPPVSKFLSFDEMNLGIGLLAAAVYYASHSLRDRVSNRWSISAIAIFIAITYPLLFPSALVIMAMMALFHATAIISQSSPIYQRLHLGKSGGADPKEGIRLLICIVAVTAVIAAYAHIFFAPRNDPLMHFVGLREIPEQAIRVFVFVGPWLALIVMQQPERDNRSVWFVLGLSTFALCACYVLVAMPLGVQYKFIFGATLCASPLVASSIGDFLCSRRRHWWQFYLPALVLLFGMILRTSWQVHVPRRDLDGAPNIDESRLFIKPVPKIGWLDAIADETPFNTVVIVNEEPVPVSVLTNRSSFLGADNGDRGRYGYIMRTAEILLNVKGYSREEYNIRLLVRNEIFADGEANDFAELTKRLRSLRRPLAIHFTQSTAYSKWLAGAKIGRALYTASDGVVWLID
jgi:hypothetical protein